MREENDWTKVRHIPSDPALKGSAAGAGVEQRKREQTLEDSEERWRSYVESSPHGVFVVDENGRYLEVNPAACRMTGYREEELLRMTIGNLLASESIQAGLDDFRDLRRGKNISREYAYFHKSGEVRWWTVSAAPLGDRRFIGFTFDVTGQRRAEAELRESRLRQDAAVSGARVGLWDWDIRTGRVWYSKEWKAQIGHDEHEVGSGYEEWESRVHPDDLQKILGKIRTVLEGEAPGFSAEFRFRHKNGSWIWIMTDASVVRDTDGAPLRVVGSHLDITERVAAQEETLKLKEELAHVQRLDSIGRLAGGVAHDFNNMLNVILGHTDLLGAEPGLSPEAQESVGEIRQAARHSADLTRQLLGYARRQAVAPAVLDLNRVCEEMLQMLRRLLGESIRLSWEPDPNLWAIQMDPTQVHQILMNLCVNAREAVRRDGSVGIATKNRTVMSREAARPLERSGEFVLLCVQDDGIGMNRDTLQHIFEPFFTTREFNEGAGLGLATVYGIVKQNRGFLEVESAPGEGSQFEVFLPRHCP